MYFDGPDLTLEAGDRCLRCPVREYCPLLDALIQGVALLATDSLGVTACHLFKVLRQHQRVQAPLKLLP